jgi:hypothetical protein
MHITIEINYYYDESLPFLQMVNKDHGMSLNFLTYITYLLLPLFQVIIADKI